MISSYTDLQTAATEWLARDNDATLIARIPTFVQLAEAKFNRELFVRQMEQRSTATIDTNATDPEFILLPSDFQSMRRVRLSSASGKPSLEFKPGKQMDEYRTFIADATGRPQFFSILGTEMELAPTPDQDYTIEMVYRQNIPPLADNSSNWLLALAPDLYLYAALLEATPYIRKDDRIPVWQGAFTTALQGLNDLSKTAAFNAGPLTMRLSGIIAP